LTMISDDRAELALRFLVDTDEKAAELKGEVERAEFFWKRTREALFIHADGTVAERTAQAGQHPKTHEAHEAYVKAIQTYSFVANKRDTEKIVLDVFRTLCANRRTGNI
jgi:hypothetical protein